MRGRIFLRLGALLLFSLFQLSLSISEKRPKEGDIAPDFRLPNMNGDTLKLSSLKGHVVLVHFWASWCRTCRAESKKIVQVYQQYKDKQFKTGKGMVVIYVSLDENKVEWEKAINEDGLDKAFNVSDLKRWQNFAVQAYKVQFIPDNFLIDGNGKIIGEGQITNYLGDYLKDEIQK